MSTPVWPLKSWTLTPIGQVQGGRDQPIDDAWGPSRARIQLDPTRFQADALAGLGDFSHLDVIFLFDRVADEKIETGARHPRNRKDWPLVGIFAQRGKNRPNRLGVSTCKLLNVEGLSLAVEGLDAIDGTPVLDLKPNMMGFDPRGPRHEPAWAQEIMSAYW